MLPIITLHPDREKSPALCADHSAARTRLRDVIFKVKTPVLCFLILIMLVPYVNATEHVSLNSSQALPNVYVLNPGNGATSQKVNLNIKSKQVIGATTYEIQLSTVPDFSTNVIASTGGYIQYFENLKYNTLYYARVRTDLDSRFGRVTTFTTIVPDVYLANPTDQGTNAKVYGAFTAKEVPGASLYTLEISKQSDFSGNVVVITSTSKYLTRTGIEYSTLYYARMKTDLIDAYGKTTSFTTRPPEMDAFLSSPANGATNVQAISPAITVNRVLNAGGYTVDISTTPDFSSDVITRSTSGSFRTVYFPTLKYGTTYYARVKTDISGYGVTTRFTTTNEPPVVVKVSTPSSNGHNPKMTTLTIQPIYGAAFYTLQLSTTPDFTTLVPVKTLSDYQSSFALRDLSYSTTYYARATSNVSSEYGPVSSFTTRAPIAARRLWGMTSKGGTYNKGTLFSYSLDTKTFTKHQDLTAETPYWGELAQSPNGFYGLAGNQMFYYSYDNTFHITTGKYEPGALMLASDNHIYVNTRDTDKLKAMIYKVAADTLDRAPRTIYTFPTRGYDPYFALAEGEAPDRFLYNATYVRGLYYSGSTYRILNEGAAYATLHDFNSTDGWGVRGVIYGNDGYLYGVSTGGGAYNKGVIFKHAIDGSGFMKLHDFRDETGSSPNGKLIKVGNALYGTTFWGGKHDYHGVIFRINIDGTGYTVLKDFDGISGSNSIQGLVAGDDGYLYGMTRAGGNYTKGVLYQIRPDGTGFAVLVDFNSGTGMTPTGDLLFLEDELPQALPAARSAGEESAIRFGPNPFQTSFSVEFLSDLPRDARIIIKDMQGNRLEEQVLSAEGPLTIGAGLKEGLYIMQVITGSEVQSYRLVKN